MELLESKLPTRGDPNFKKTPKASKRNEEIPTYPHEDDDSEKEVFFGRKSDKEVNGRNAKFTRRETLMLMDGYDRRSFDVVGIVGTPTDSSKYRKNAAWTQRRSTTKKDSIEEEEEIVNDEGSPPVEEEKNNEGSELAILTTPLKCLKLESNEEKEIVTPPRRKINNVERKYRSRSPLAKISNSEEEEVDTSKESSLVDVNNDQMFDNSVFTEYDAGDLSCMSERISKKWKRRINKDDKKKHEEGMVAAKMPDLVLQHDESFQQQHDNEGKRDESVSASDNDAVNMSTCSEWFDTTRDEMILYEKFGEDYDVVVNKMTHAEKAKLKEEVSQCVPKDASALLAMHKKNSLLLEDEEEEEIISVEETPNVSIMLPTSDDGGAKTPKLLMEPPIPKPRTMTPQKLTVEKLQETAQSTPNPNLAVQQRLFKTPEYTPSYLRPTTASKLRSSPRKGDIVLSPGHPLYQQRKDQLDVTPCPRAGISPIFKNTDSLKRNFPSGLDLNKIVSPVGQYIRANPVPPIMRQIRAKPTRHFDDELRAFELEEEEKENKIEPPKRIFPPLPFVDYKSSRMALEQELQGNVEPPKLLPKAFGTTNTVEAIVVKHMGRERVPKSLDIEGIVNNYSPNSKNSPSGVTLKKFPPRESTIPNIVVDESTMEVSIREVRPITKMTTLPRKLQK